MFREAQLDALHALIRDLLPLWSTSLAVSDNEISPNRVLVGTAGRLCEAVHKAVPPRGLQIAVLTGSYEGAWIYLFHNESTLPELDNISLDIIDRSTMEGQDISAWARTFFQAVVERLNVRYANVHIHEEFKAKNMIDDETGVEAIGVQLWQSLPGLYWLNYFGTPYVKLMGRDRLLSAPAYEVAEVNGGILLALDATADAWQSLDYRRRERDVIEHLGRQFFFSRHDPEYQTVAPEFHANE